MGGKVTPVAQMDPARKTSDIVGPDDDEATVAMEQQDKMCYWNDEAFDDGDQVTLGDECYECSFSKWIKIRG